MLSLIEIESAVVVVSDELGNNIFIFYYHKQLAIGLDRLLHLALLAKSITCISIAFLALDLVSLAYGTFALLHLPKMPELKGRDTSRFQSHPIDLESIPYKDKGREKQALALRKKKGRLTFHAWKFSN